MKRAFFVVGVVVFVVALFLARQQEKPPIKIGILHSRTGTMAISEKPVIDATVFAVDELNRSGGVLGRQVEPVLADGASDSARFGKEARRLIEKEKVAAIFGCWTSASRKEVKPIVEKAENLLVYPLQYEGLEESSAIVYTGSVPNQQIKPAIKWALDNLGNRFYLVGSDYIFPRIANHLIRDLSSLLGATVIAEHYQPLGGEDFSAIAKEIAVLRPAVVFNTLNGDSNIAFFAALRQQGVSAEEVPVLSFSITETELHVMTGVLPTGTMTGHYASWSYFETVASEENQSFVKRFRKRYGAARHLNDPMVSAYLGVKLWAQAVEEAKSFDPVKVRSSFSRQSMSGPGGIIYIDDRNHHAWKPNRIGRINDKGQFEIVWESRKPIRPESYPAYAERSNWQDLEGLFYGRWQEHWAKDSEVKP